MQDTKLSAGDPIESRCTKCRKNTNHIIVAVTEKGPAKVECNTCGGQHKYRSPTAVKKPAVRRTVDPKAAEQKEWASLQPDMSDKHAIDYSMSAAFKVGVVLNHPVFGLGVVKNQAGPRKIKVLFEDGSKTMRCK